MVLWGGATAQGDLLDDGAAYRADGWDAIDPAPAGRSDHEATWTGDEMLVWGGCCTSDGGPLGDGLALDSRDEEWRAMPPAGLEPRQDHTAVWTRSFLVVWGGRAGLDRSFADGAAYEPSGGRWTELPTAPLSPRGGHSSVWTGDEMLVWGGCCDAGQKGLPDGAAIRLAAPATPSVRPTPGDTTARPTPAVDDEGASGSLPLAALIGAAVVAAGGLGLAIRKVRSREMPPPG
jgi:hypothetical protein